MSVRIGLTQHVALALAIFAMGAGFGGEGRAAPGTELGVREPNVRESDLGSGDSSSRGAASRAPSSRTITLRDPASRESSSRESTHESNREPPPRESARESAIRESAIRELAGGEPAAREPGIRSERRRALPVNPEGMGSLGIAPVPPPPSPRATSSTLALAALDRQLAELDIEEKNAKEKISDLGAKLSRAHARSLGRGRSFYRLTRAGMLPVGGGFDELVSHAMRVERARRVLVTDLDEERTLRREGADLSRALERVARDRVALGSQRASLDAERAAMEDEARRQSAFDRAFSSSSGGNGYVAVYGGNGAAPDHGSGGFAGARGRLLFPLAGRAEIHPARREGTDGPGLEIHGSLGSPVRAVFGGRVAFADRYGAYGRLVIMDHGDHYYTVSGNLASIDVKVGDELSAGERIGSVGDEGKGAMLYFEIRHGTETVAPNAWLGM